MNKLMKMLITGIGLASIVSCSTPTTPKFPEITCQKVTLTKGELKVLSHCKEGVVCQIPHETLKKILAIRNADKACLEEYKAAAKEYN